MSEVRDELDPPFEIQEPANLAGPVLFNSPHSGSVYPRGFLQSSRLDLGTLRRSEDSYVDDLIGGVVGRGYPLMRAHFPRCFVTSIASLTSLIRGCSTAGCRPLRIPARCGWRAGSARWP